MDINRLLGDPKPVTMTAGSKGPAEVPVVKDTEVSQMAQGDEEWDDCQSPAVVDGDYTLVDDLLLLEINSPGGKELPIGGDAGLSMPNSEEINRLIDSVKDYCGPYSYHVDEKTTRPGPFSDFLDTIDQSFAGTYAMLYKQHVSCTAILYHCKFLDERRKELHENYSQMKESTASQVAHAQREVEEFMSKNQRLREEMALKDRKFQAVHLTEIQSREASVERALITQSRIATLEQSEKQLKLDNQALRLDIHVKDKKISTQAAELQAREPKYVDILASVRRSEAQLRLNNQELLLEIGEKDKKISNQGAYWKKREQNLNDTVADFRRVVDDKNGRVLELETELRQTKDELVEVNETLRDFAQQDLFKQSIIKRLESELTERNVNFATKLGEHNDTIHCLQTQIEAWKSAVDQARSTTIEAVASQCAAEDELQNMNNEIEHLKELRRSSARTVEKQDADLTQLEQAQQSLKELVDGQCADLERLRTTLRAEIHERKRQETMKTGAVTAYNQLKAKYAALKDRIPSSSRAK